MRKERTPQKNSDPYNIPQLENVCQKLGFSFSYKPETTSTMLDVSHYALTASSPLPTIVVADHQTAGVGRDETKKWHDTPGSSILMSALFYIDENVVTEFADLIALRVCLALRNTGTDIQIKAPNDIVHEGKKISGILVQNIYDDNGDYKGTNVGIGVNVHYTNDELETYPTEYSATSIDVITHHQNNRQELLIDILDAIATAGVEAAVIDTTPSVRTTQDAAWREHSYLLGRRVVITEDGTLLLEGTVITTEIGRGIAVALEDGSNQRVSVFDSSTKVRVVN